MGYPRIFLGPNDFFCPAPSGNNLQILRKFKWDKVDCINNGQS